MKLTVFDYEFEIDDSLVDAPPGAVERQVRAYEQSRDDIDLRVQFPDSFTGDVMRAMADIPLGETRTYGELASALGTSAVAVGGACGRNPVPLVVPCHRVVAADSLGGFSSPGGVRAKEALLAHERDDPVQQTLE